MSETVTDANGRVIKVRKMTVLDQVRVLRAIGPAQSSNQAYVNIVTMAVSVSEIDGVPCPMPSSEIQIDAAIERIGDDGFAALMADMEAQVKAIQLAAATAILGGAPAVDPLVKSD